MPTPNIYIHLYIYIERERDCIYTVWWFMPIIVFIYDTILVYNFIEEIYTFKIVIHIFFKVLL